MKKLEEFTRFIGFISAPFLWELSLSWRNRYYSTRKYGLKFDQFVQDEFWKVVQGWFK